MNWLLVLKNCIHYGGHFILPVIIAYVFFKSNWRIIALIFLGTMLVDLDHLLASPIFDANRCSIGYHFLHSYLAITLYVVFVFIKQTRIIALGLLLHMFFDYQDCFW